MLKNAVKRGFVADYVLTDSWFYNHELIALISKLNKKAKLNLISMARMGTTKYKLTSNGIFASAIEDALQNSIACELQKMFWIILEIYSDFTGVDIIEVTRSIFRDEQACNKIKLHNPVFFENLKKYQAA